MNKTRTKRAYLSMLTAGIYEAITLIAGLIIPRLILKAYGSDCNGLVSSVSQFLSYITVLQLGVAGPTRVALYNSLSKNDMIKTSGIVNATERYYRKISIAFVVYMALLAIVFPYIAETQYSGFQTAMLVVIIGIGTLAEYCFGITFSTFLTAAQSGYVYTIIKIVAKIVNTVVVAMLINSGCTIFMVKISSAVLSALSPIVLNMYVHKHYKLDRTVAPDYSGFKQRKAAVSSTIANIVHEKTDIFLLTIFTTTQLVSVYSVYMIVMTGLTNIMKVFTTSLEAPFGDLWARGEREAILKNLSIYEYLLYCFVCVVFSCAGVLLMPFITIYTSGVNDINYIRPFFGILLTITTASFCIRQPYITIVQAAGKYEETKVGCYVEAVINIVLSLILVRRFDVVGITIGTLVANIIRTVQYALYISNKMISRSIWVVIKRIIWGCCTSAIIIIVCKLIPGLICCTGWISWCVSGIECFVIACAITIIMSIIFYMTNFRSALNIIGGMIFK